MEIRQLTERSMWVWAHMFYFHWKRQKDFICAGTSDIVSKVLKARGSEEEAWRARQSAFLGVRVSLPAQKVG